VSPPDAGRALLGTDAPPGAARGAGLRPPGNDPSRGVQGTRAAGGGWRKGGRGWRTLVADGATRCPSSRSFAPSAAISTPAGVEPTRRRPVIVRATGVSLCCGPSVRVPSRSVHPPFCCARSGDPEARFTRARPQANSLSEARIRLCDYRGPICDDGEVVQLDGWMWNKFHRRASVSRAELGFDWSSMAAASAAQVSHLRRTACASSRAAPDKLRCTRQTQARARSPPQLATQSARSPFRPWLMTWR
jgi:hypothetical protein